MSIKLLDILKEMKTPFWYITHYDDDLEELNTIYFEEFDKSKIEKEFNKIAKSLKNEEEVWLQKDTKKDIGDTILVVVNKNGKLMREVTKGSKTFYKKYSKINL